MECLIMIPVLYLVLKFVISLWNSDVEQSYNDAQVKASYLLGLGQKDEASLVMERALIDYKRFKIRKVLGYKLQ